MCITDEKMEQPTIVIEELLDDGSGKNIEDFKASNEVKLKQDLMAQINTVLTQGDLVNIYFPAGLMLQK